MNKKEFIQSRRKVKKEFKKQVPGPLSRKPGTMIKKINELPPKQKVGVLGLI